MNRLATTTWVVGSGKGGVGKSTITLNLAVALAIQGFKVGILDADIYGPSIPIMTGLRQMGPQIVPGPDGRERVLPFSKFGVQLMSIGFFLEESRSVLWRGPILHQTLTKMIQGTDWQTLDFLLIDLPPGTGDVPLSLSKLLSIDGALIVSTPQEVALLDALKAIHSFDLLKIPIVGMVENMAGPIFGEGNTKNFAFNLGVPFLGSIPLDPAIRQGGDAGYPSAYHAGDEKVGEHFRSIATLLTGEQHVVNHS